MLPCERPHPPLSRAEFARVCAEVLPYWLADYVLVIRHVVSSPEKYSPDLRTMQALYADVLAYDIPKPELLNTVVGYVLNQMYWDGKARRLTPAEQEIHAAAWRLSDSLWGPHTKETYGYTNT